MENPFTENLSKLREQYINLAAQQIKNYKQLRILEAQSENRSVTEKINFQLDLEQIFAAPPQAVEDWEKEIQSIKEQVVKGLQEFRWITAQEETVHFISEMLGKLREAPYMFPAGESWFSWNRELLNSTISHYLHRLGLTRLRLKSFNLEADYLEIQYEELLEHLSSNRPTAEFTHYANKAKSDLPNRKNVSQTIVKIPKHQPVLRSAETKELVDKANELLTKLENGITLVDDSWRTKL